MGQLDSTRRAPPRCTSPRTCPGKCRRSPWCSGIKVEFESKKMTPVSHLIGSMVEAGCFQAIGSMVETRRFQAMGQLHSACAVDPPWTC
jgi:hypothetical protein